MKKILITGANSYIGTSFEKYLKENFHNEYVIDTVDTVDMVWATKSFCGYDSVFHVAGIAHSDHGKISQEKAKCYYEINTDLAVMVAKKAKKDGVKQFIFMSSSIVYGESAPIGKTKIITLDTPIKPANCYGDSKAKAEESVCHLEDESFKVAIIRSPMIYGKGSKGNYRELVKIAKSAHVFPYIENCRSVLYVGNLCEFVRLLVENEDSGTFFPQNSEYINTSELVKIIASANGKKVHLVKGTQWILSGIGHFTGLVNKAFGTLIYDMSISEYSVNYRKYSLEDSIKEER